MNLNLGLDMRGRMWYYASFARVWRANEAVSTIQETPRSRDSEGLGERKGLVIVVSGEQIPRSVLVAVENSTKLTLGEQGVLGHYCYY